MSKFNKKCCTWLLMFVLCAGSILPDDNYTVALNRLIQFSSARTDQTHPISSDVEQDLVTVVQAWSKMNQEEMDQASLLTAEKVSILDPLWLPALQKSKKLELVMQYVPPKEYVWLENAKQNQMMDALGKMWESLRVGKYLQHLSSSIKVAWKTQISLLENLFLLQQCKEHYACLDATSKTNLFDMIINPQTRRKKPKCRTDVTEKVLEDIDKIWHLMLDEIEQKLGSLESEITQLYYSCSEVEKNVFAEAGISTAQALVSSVYEGLAQMSHSDMAKFVQAVIGMPTKDLVIMSLADHIWINRVVIDLANPRLNMPYDSVQVLSILFSCLNSRERLITNFTELKIQALPDTIEQLSKLLKKQKS